MTGDDLGARRRSAFRAVTQLMDHPLARGVAPAWASEWGEDRYGVFVAFRVGDVTQRLRWIPPGSFMMGSPESESGRWDDEGPQHRVTISRGYWLADTPCTQALWQQVMGENPSRFQSPDRPVERVSWEMVKEFIDRLNERVDGLDARLPSEAEWEYACRAGTTTSSYAGEVEFLGTSNAPMLDEIAWYDGNCGVDFDLEDGEDSSEWPEKQYAGDKAGTRIVATKEPNAWGLYDTLGNVWEWCEDWFGAPSKSGELGGRVQGKDRVIRGGSWFGDASYVRAAARRRFHPSGLGEGLGFRLLRGQVPAESRVSIVRAAVDE